jgi:serine/threonine protein kinase
VKEFVDKNLGPRGRYKLRGLLARGGFGAVYRAWDSSLQREVAVKLMIPTLIHEPAFVERFRREAVAVAQLRHPHILEVYDFGEESDGLLYLVMPLIEGGTLKDQFSRGGRQPWPPRQVGALAAQILPALDFAHEHGIVHRDVKPANVLQEREWAWLADFGIARMAMGDDGGGMTLTGASAIGTPEYMAPEQVVPTYERPLDGRADLYAFGVVLYELLTGRVPFRGQTTWETCFQVIQAPLPAPRSLNPALSAALEAVLQRALARDRDERFASGARMEAALLAAIEASPASQLGQAVVPLASDPPVGPERTLVSGGTLVELAKPAPVSPSQYLTRLWRAARLDPSVYVEVKRDVSAAALVQAAAVIALAGMSSSVGFTLLQQESTGATQLVAAGLGGLVGGLAGWALWSFLAWAIGSGLMRGSGTPGQLLRTSGLAQTPGLLGFLTGVPLVGVLIYMAIAVWSLLTALGSLRQTLALNTGPALATIVLAGAPALLVQFGVNVGCASLVTRALGA